MSAFTSHVKQAGGAYSAVDPLHDVIGYGHVTSSCKSPPHTVVFSYAKKHYVITSGLLLAVLCSSN